jgi:hypothetical protein
MGSGLPVPGLPAPLSVPSAQSSPPITAEETWDLIQRLLAHAASCYVVGGPSTLKADMRLAARALRQGIAR